MLSINKKESKILNIQLNLFDLNIIYLNHDNYSQIVTYDELYIQKQKSKQFL